MTGILPEDAPDPRVEQAERLKLMPIPVMGLVSQPSLEDTDTVGLGYGRDARGYSEMTASVTYTLWRNPMDRSDPINLADLNEQTRKAIEDVPPWPRPAWLVEQVKRMQYPSSIASRSGSRPGASDHTPVPAIRFSYGHCDFGELSVQKLLRRLPIFCARLHVAVWPSDPEASGPEGSSKLP